MESIIQDERCCLVCRTVRNLHKHHVFGGTANRRMSERYGLTAWLCGYHHNLSNAGVHFDKKLDTAIKRYAQQKFEETHDRKQFIDTFGKSYV